MTFNDGTVSWFFPCLLLTLSSTVVRATTFPEPVKESRKIAAEHNALESGRIAVDPKAAEETSAAQPANLAVTQGRTPLTLLDKDNWKIILSGFVELDVIRDSTRSLMEIPGNSPVDRLGTVAGSNGRTQFSVRHSRFAFAVLPPLVSEWKTKGYLEYDLLGFEPAPNSTSPTSLSEGGYFTSPTLRMRHAYISAENNGWLFLLGQAWTLFGWQPYYFMASLSVAPVSGMVFERSPQLTLIKNLGFAEDNTVQVGMSLTRPVQRDGQYPGVDAGIRLSLGMRKSGYSNSPTGESKPQPLSVAVSGTVRSFDTPANTSNPSERNNYLGSAVAVSAMLPIIASPDGKSAGNTLSFQSSFSTGKGYADQFGGWSGGLGLTTTGTTGTTNLLPNLDPGQGGFGTPNVASTFGLVQLRSYNLQLQYHLPTEWRTFLNLAYAQLYSPNIGQLSPGPNGYDRSEIAFINAMHDFTSQIRAGFEYALQETHYLDNSRGLNRRFQMSFYFIF